MLHIVLAWNVGGIKRRSGPISTVFRESDRPALSGACCAIQPVLPGWDGKRGKSASAFFLPAC